MAETKGWTEWRRKRGESNRAYDKRLADLAVELQRGANSSVYSHAAREVFAKRLRVVEARRQKLYLDGRPTP